MGRQRVRGGVGRYLAVVTVAVAGTTAGCPLAVSAAPAPTPTWPAHPDWQQYVEAPSTAAVNPVRIVSTSGPVSGATGLVAAGGTAPARLTMTAGGPVPAVVIDYGHDVGGIPFFVAGAESHSPILRATYSEALSDLGPRGDQAPSGSGAGDPSRVDDLTISSSGRRTTGLIQGGERYERISLVSPGTVTLSAVGIRFTAVRATASQYRGWFDSSSNELNRIWYDGAYTTQLDELPAATLPAPWRIAARALTADGGQVGVLGVGHHWTDYTMSFDTRVVKREAGWVVRAPSSVSGYLFVLRRIGAATVLQAIATGPGQFAVIASATLPAHFNPGAWHHVTTTAAGGQISASIDGRRLIAFTTADLPAGVTASTSGTVGFAALGSVAQFRGLVVTAPNGTTLVHNDLSEPSSLSLFAGPDVSTPDPLPAIMDGAKRDRLVWSGDLGVEGPNVFSTTGADSFVRGSLELLASDQAGNGEAGGDVDPSSPIGTFPETGSTYSATYSMDEVDNIATYFLYTGDLGFVRSQWPMITRELAYNAASVDNRGLLTTDATNGMDWDYYDGPKLGEVTASNAIYYQTLTSAATLAQALGHTAEATAYASAARQLRSAINRDLFNASTDLYRLSNLQPSAVAQDGNSLAVLFGVAPPALDATILSALATALPSTPYGPLPFTVNAGYRADVSPFVTNEEIEALFEAGDTASALSLLQTLWGYMDRAGPNDTGTDWEVLTAAGAPGFGAYTSLAHGWASGATADLSADVLGVRPVTPGFRTWLVAPHPGTLTWAEGDVPTPSGPIDVRVAQNRSSHAVALQIRGPARTRGSVSVPVPENGAVVTVRATGPGQNSQKKRILRAPAGVSSLSVALRGAVTYVIDVSPT